MMGGIVRIDLIETPEVFGRLEANWNAVYDADPDAQIFLSWSWLSGWLRQISSPWLILAARADEGGAYVAFLPLRIQVKAAEALLRNEVSMAGNFAADYTGILCAPDFDHQAIPAFARYLKQMNWGRLNLDNMRLSEARHRLLLAHFPKAKFNVEEISRVGKIDGIDNSLCPFAPLPADWETYLAGLSANTRQKIRRLLKLIDASDEYRITHATADTIDRDIETLLRFWEIKWRPRKGDTVDSLVRSNRRMLTTSFKSGLLFLPTLWQGDRPAAALATFVDPRKRAFLFYMTGRDENFEGPSPGLTLHGHSIRHAIANGFAEYDFLRGNEAYKYSFGVKERLIKCIAVSTKNGANLGGQLDRRTLADALREATELHQAGKLAEAERGYRQILELDRSHADAIHRLGQLLTTRGRHGPARQQFTTLTAIMPDTHKSWLCLAQSCEALGEHLEAARSYRKVIQLRPDLPDGFTGLGKALHGLDRISAFDAALHAVIGSSQLQDGKTRSRRPKAGGLPDQIMAV
jgi:CelD/BcsL family acetyltransferase involved in cellulose biosynthesis